MKKVIKAIQLAGGQSKVAQICSKHSGRNIKQGHVWYWINRKKQWPAEFVIPLVEAIDNKVSKNEIRPDIYPN